MTESEAARNLYGPDPAKHWATVAKIEARRSQKLARRATRLAWASVVLSVTALALSIGHWL
jgi:hypothetical protein